TTRVRPANDSESVRRPLHLKRAFIGPFSKAIKRIECLIETSKLDCNWKMLLHCIHQRIEFHSHSFAERRVGPDVGIEVVSISDKFFHTSNRAVYLIQMIWRKNPSQFRRLNYASAAAN